MALHDSSTQSSPREERVGRGPRRGVSNVPPLPGPLLHPMEERGLLCLRLKQSAKISRNELPAKQVRCHRPGGGCLADAPQFVQTAVAARTADCPDGLAAGAERGARAGIDSSC